MKSHHIDGSACGYRLRLNRRKTRRASEFGGSYDSSSVVPPCKECCRKFCSLKGLFAHMVKRHMVNERTDGIEEDFNCRDGSDMVNNSQSLDNSKRLPNRKKRSLRRKRCDAMKTINSLSSSDHAVGVELERELEEVAMCLMMLSRDSFNGSSSVAGVHDSSVVGSSEDNSAPVFHKDPISANASADFSIPGNFKNRSERNGVEVSYSGIEVPETGSGKTLDVMNENQAKSSKTCRSSSKRKFPDDSRNGKSLSIVLLALDGADSEVDEDLGKIMASRFECNTCKKTFHSYQALGGHRASHTKSKAACGSVDTSIDRTELLPPGKTTTDKPKAETVSRLNKKKKKTEEEVSKGDEHKCTVCLKVFSSGQALGGHKRSHLPEAAKTIKPRLPVVQKPVRDFLDLNLPAPLEEEEGTTSSIVNFKPCLAAGRSHPVIGLIAN